LDSRIRGAIVDRGIEKGEFEMRDLSKQLGHIKSEQQSHVGRDEGEDLPERAGISRDEETAHERQVNPEAVRESFKEAELDPIAENEPEQGEKAA